MTEAIQAPCSTTYENKDQTLKATSKSIGVCGLCGSDTTLFDYFGKKCCNSCNIGFVNSINRKDKINCNHLNKIVGSRCKKCRYSKYLDAGMVYTDRKLSCDICAHEQAITAHKNVLCCRPCLSFIYSNSKK